MQKSLVIWAGIQNLLMNFVNLIGICGIIHYVYASSRRRNAV